MTSCKRDAEEKYCEINYNCVTAKILLNWYWKPSILLTPGGCNIWGLRREERKHVDGWNDSFVDVLQRNRTIKDRGRSEVRLDHERN